MPGLTIFSGMQPLMMIIAVVQRLALLSLLRRRLTDNGSKNGDNLSALPVVAVATPSPAGLIS